MSRTRCLATVLVALHATSLHAQVPRSGPAVTGFLFGDALYTEGEGASVEGFRLGQMVAHANATLSERVLFFGELSITGSNSGYSLAMERAILRFEASDAFKLSVGRFHAPVSYWNTAFHHGLWLQGSVARPEAVKFGSRFVPVHFVGAVAEGHVVGTPVHYTVGLGNGRGTNIAAGGDGGDVNDDRAIVLGASMQPASLFGARVGGALYLDRVPAAAGPDSDERIASAHVVWDRGALELVAEYFDVRHEPVTGGSSTGSTAYYLHAGVRLPDEFRAFTPYARWEDIDVGTGDPVYTGAVADYEALVAGIRYDFDTFAALKAEYRKETRAGGTSADSYYIQASFAIPVSGGQE